MIQFSFLKVFHLVTLLKIMTFRNLLNILLTDEMCKNYYKTPPAAAYLNSVTVPLCSAHELNVPKNELQSFGEAQESTISTASSTLTESFKPLILTLCISQTMKLVVRPYSIIFGHFLAK